MALLVYVYMAFPKHLHMTLLAICLYGFASNMFIWLCYISILVHSHIYTVYWVLFTSVQFSQFSPKPFNEENSTIANNFYFTEYVLVFNRNIIEDE